MRDGLKWFWGLVKQYRINIVLAFLAVTGPTMALPQDVDLASYNEMLVRALTDSRVEVLELKDEIDDLKIEIFTLNLTIEFLEKENSALRTSYGLSQ